MMRTGWYLEAMDNCWYYMKPDGSMVIGWQQINGKWYYFNPATIGITGWSSQGLTWNFDIQKNQGIPQGAMYKNQRTPDGYLVDEQGAWIQQSYRALVREMVSSNIQQIFTKCYVIIFL